jgi:hypothetical protein
MERPTTIDRHGRRDEMTESPFPRCPSCGAELVPEMDPTSPPDAEASVLLADPPFRYVCVSLECSPPSMTG